MGRSLWNSSLSKQVSAPAAGSVPFGDAERAQGGRARKQGPGRPKGMGTGRVRTESCGEEGWEGRRGEKRSQE